METAREWLAAEPENSQAHMAAGQALINLKRYQEAEPHVERVLANRPRSGTAHRFLSIIHYHQKRFRQADEEIQRALSLAPYDFYNWYQVAWMFYRNGDLASARKYAEKAREINPRNPATLNLLALCAPKGSLGAAERLRQCREALELDPENADAHNNIGVHYLNLDRDFAAAEECFRRALFFNPRSKTARKNLFITIKHRDKLYRILCLPKDMVYQALRAMREARKTSVLAYSAGVVIWIVAGRYAIGVLLLWGLLVWPMVKVYEFLTLGDLRASAGEVGARRGGFLNYRRWSLKLRLGIFGLCMLSFWSAIGWLVYSWQTASPNNPPDLGVMLLAGGILIFIAVFGVLRIRKMMIQSEARSRARRLATVLNSKRTIHE